MNLIAIATKLQRQVIFSLKTLLLKIDSTFILNELNINSAMIIIIIIFIKPLFVFILKILFYK